MNAKWRPMMGWMYMAVCICDFIIFPILWSVHQAVDKGQVNLQWDPLTLKGAGLFHMAMGAVLGIAAYGRTQEKMAGVNNVGFDTPPTATPTFSPPPTGFGTPAPSASTGFGSTPAPATAVTTVTPLGNAHVPTGPQPEL